MKAACNLTAVATALAAAVWVAAVPVYAAGQPASPAPATPAPASPAPGPAPGAPAATSPSPTPVVAGRIHLVVQRAFGKPLFVIAPGRMVVRGTVVPYVAGQKVKVSFYRSGRKVEVKTVSVRAGRSAIGGSVAGQFRIGFASRYAGLVQAHAAHYATPQQSAFSGRTRRVRFVHVNLGPGARGQSVRLLQSELGVLHYAVGPTGVFDDGTGRALIAYRKVTGLERVPFAGRGLFERLARRAGSFHVRYRGDGRHVEADLTRQVLAEIESGGRVRAIYTMSSGKPSTPTVIGRFRVYSKTPGVNSEGMVDANYFIRGYAIHGYAELPTYAASHGCLRVPIPNAASIFGWVQTGTRVDVYNESGGGNHRVNSNAGP